MSDEPSVVSDGYADLPNAVWKLLVFCFRIVFMDRLECHLLLLAVEGVLYKISMHSKFCKNTIRYYDKKCLAWSNVELSRNVKK